MSLKVQATSSQHPSTSIQCASDLTCEDRVDAMVQKDSPFASFSSRAHLDGRVAPAVSVVAQRPQTEATKIGTRILAQSQIPVSAQAVAHKDTASTPQGLTLIPLDDEKILNPEDYLASGMTHAQLSFHSHVGGNASARTIALNKKDVHGEDVTDTTRQNTMTEKFVQIKHVLGLGSQTGLSKVPANYSVLEHYIELHQEDGSVSHVDLLDHMSIQKLLRERGVDDSTEHVGEVYQELLTLQRDLQLLIDRETGVINVNYEADYMGNKAGRSPFLISTQGLFNMANNPKNYLSRSNLQKRGLIEGKDANLTTLGNNAMRQMREVRVLQRLILERYQLCIDQKKGRLLEIRNLKATHPESHAPLKQEEERLNAALAELETTQQELAQVNLLVVDFLLMELNGKLAGDRTGLDLIRQDREHSVDQNTLAGNLDYLAFSGDHIIGDFHSTLVSANRSRLPWKKPYDVGQEEREFAAALGGQLHDLNREVDSLDPMRVRKLTYLKRAGVRAIPQADRAVDFLISAIARPGTIDTRGYKDTVELSESLRLYNDKKAAFQQKGHAKLKDALKAIKNLDKETQQLITKSVHADLGQAAARTA